ncbi:hypothetical protein PCANC_27580 [Puccinia coronata f. sp. avenae]|uniref:Uncharacterized protein n=1 Tax=Puccinia coronata f. sp. avenae TaxID=200324 RepID=A0A2N5TLK7_9BASI|nr:hypothetical protein PCANC_27580 [Puccinia coronata f. sp. avenae]
MGNYLAGFGGGLSSTPPPHYSHLSILPYALKDTPINGGLTYEGPKVAEYPGR